MELEQQISKRRGRPKGWVKNKFLPDGRRICTRCKQPKPTDAFVVDHSKADGLSSRCTECRRLYYRYIACRKCNGPRFGDTPGLCRKCYTVDGVERLLIPNLSEESQTLERLTSPPKLRGKYCKRCGQWFTFQGNPKKRKVCGPECARALGRELAQAQSLLPYDFDVLYDLYWNQGLSTNQIAERYGLTSNGKSKGGANVHTRMRALGVPTRKKGKRAELVECIIEGCNAPVYKVLHNKKGLYGRRCLEHWVAHRQKLASDYWLNTVRWRKLGLGEAATPESMGEHIEQVVPRTLPSEIRDEVCQELALRLLTREISVDDLSKAARELAKKFFSDYQSKYGPISLDAPLYDGNGITLGETLEG